MKAEPRVNPRAVLVMREMGIDISDHKPCQVDEYMDEEVAKATETDDLVPATMPGSLRSKL